ncbi:hypothetical protein B003_08885 [Vibrio breoganii 1C10]|nr:hypothetical protein B003_08885 [Vibrio breoganii 1C10]
MQIARLSHLRLAIALLIASLLSGCGFHFRGSYLVPEEVSSMSLTSYDDYAQFTRDVKTELRQNGIQLVTPAANVTNIHLLTESISERTLSLYQNSRAAEKELTLRASYRVVVPDVGTRTFSTQVNRSYLDNPLTALAKSVERDMIEDEMRKQAARQIIRQLARLRTDLDNDDGSFDTFIDEDGMIEAPSQRKDDQISLQAEYEKNDQATIPVELQTAPPASSTSDAESNSEADNPEASVKTDSEDTSEANRSEASQTEEDTAVDSESDVAK